MLDEALLKQDLKEHFALFWFLLLIGLVTFSIAWKLDFFKKFTVSSLPLVKGVEVLYGFGLFVFTEVILVPLLVTGIFGESVLLSVGMGWLTAVTILCGFLSTVFVYFTLPKQRRRAILQQKAGAFWQNIRTGVLSWFICFPAVMALSQVISILVLLIFRQSMNDQSAVRHLRSLMDHPLLFSLTTMEIVTLVPFAEEFLFRGLLQSWLKHRLGNVTLGITVSSVIFALFHFSWSQGVTNIELLSTLFMLSCFLGYLYERQRSLWSTVSLHSFFNLISVLTIFKQVE